MTISSWRMLFVVAAFLTVIALSPGRAAAQQRLTLGERCSMSTTESGTRYDTDLFSFDPGIKIYPPQFTGTQSSVAVGCLAGRSISVSVEIFHNRMSGFGSWLDVDGLSPEEAAFLPIATGRTTLILHGMMGVAEKSFLRRKPVQPYIEVGAGGAIFDVKANVRVAIIDPTDGEKLTVPSVDEIQRSIPIGAIGGGIKIRLPMREALRFGYRWSMGSQARVGIDVPLWRSAAHKWRRAAQK